MKTYLVTGCAGFIGSNFVHYMLEKYQDIRLVNLDKLTYAGNLENLKDIKDDARHIFVKGDICDKALVTDLIAKFDPDYVINFAAESHVDRSIRNPEIFVQSQRSGHRQPAAVLSRMPGTMPTPRPGRKAKSTCRFPPMKYTVLWVPKATLWKRPRCARTARTPLPKPAPICS